MTRLSVNVNKVAVLRNARGGTSPDVVHAATACLDAGAHGITVHPRPDARHIRAEDVQALAGLCRGRGVEFNLEGNPFAPPRPGYPGFRALCRQVRPDQATLVPDADGQLTSDHGFDFLGDLGPLRDHVGALQSLGCRVSLFVDAGCPRIESAADVGADRIELYTGPYAAAHGAGAAGGALAACAASAARARAAGLGVNAGHDLDQANLGDFLRGVPGVLEVSIGHALVADALHRGLDATVRAYLSILADAERPTRS